MDDDGVFAKPGSPQLIVGEDLSRLSVADLDDRVTRLQAEIARVNAERDSRGSVRAAADALFTK